MVLRDQPVGGASLRLARGLRRLGGAARDRRPAGLRRAVAQATPGCTRHRSGSAGTTSGATTPGSPGSRTRARRRSGSAGSTCGGTGQGRPTATCTGSSTGRTTSRSRSATRWPPDPPSYDAATRASDAQSSPTGRGQPGRRAGDLGLHRAPRTRAGSCCASRPACDAPGRSTRPRPALVGACDGELTAAQILTALDQILGAHRCRPTSAATSSPRVSSSLSLPTQPSGNRYSDQVAGPCALP